MDCEDIYENSTVDSPRFSNLPINYIEPDIVDDEIQSAFDIRIPVSFPVKLYKLLYLNKGIVDWMPHGMSFRVEDMRSFLTITLPQYFKQTKFESFQRQLNMYGFKRTVKGPEAGAYRHPDFQRGRIDLLAKVKRLPVNRNRSKNENKPDKIVMKNIIPIEDPYNNIDVKTLCTKLLCDYNFNCKQGSTGSSLDQKIVKFSSTDSDDKTNSGTSTVNSKRNYHTAIDGFTSSDSFDNRGRADSRASDLASSSIDRHSPTPRMWLSSSHLEANKMTSLFPRKDSSSSSSSSPSTFSSTTTGPYSFDAAANHNYADEIAKLDISQSLLHQYGELYYVPSEGGPPLRLFLERPADDASSTESSPASEATTSSSSGSAMNEEEFLLPSPDFFDNDFFPTDTFSVNFSHPGTRQPSASIYPAFSFSADDFAADKLDDDHFFQALLALE